MYSLTLLRPLIINEKTQVSAGNTLVERCIQGDKAAHKEFFMRFAPKMKALCRRFAASDDEASDMMQEGFIRVFDKLHLFKGQSALETWITRIFINNNISILRKDKMWRNMSVEIDDTINPADEDEYLDDPDEIPVETVIEKMRALPPGYRTVLNLYALENHTHKEIAEILGINEGTSRSQLLKARKMLKALLEKK